MRYTPRGVKARERVRSVPVLTEEHVEGLVERCAAHADPARRRPVDSLRRQVVWPGGFYTIHGRLRRV